MKTPIQELISEMEKSPLMFASALTLIEHMKMLEEEKEVMDKIYKDSTVQFNISSVMDEYKPFENYYNETFNTKEK